MADFEDMEHKHLGSTVLDQTSCEQRNEMLRFVKYMTFLGCVF
jgi:hypothetical protein